MPFISVKHTPDQHLSPLYAVSLTWLSFNTCNITKIHLTRWLWTCHFFRFYGNIYPDCILHRLIALIYRPYFYLMIIQEYLFTLYTLLKAHINSHMCPCFLLLYHFSILFLIFTSLSPICDRCSIAQITNLHYYIMLLIFRASLGIWKGQLLNLLHWHK